MTTIMPKSELIRQAIIFIDGELKEKPYRPLGPLLDEAGMRFNLSPLESMELETWFVAIIKGKKAVRG